ncbi:MAG: response regulator [Elusimicrobiota bacterium]
MNTESAIRILVVDDEGPVRELCARVLGPLGYEVETVRDADEAMALASEKTFDLLLTDFRMPGPMDGLALARDLRSRWPHLRIMLMTAFPAVEIAIDSLRIGAFDYLIKPFDQEYLKERVRAALAYVPPDR